MSIWKKIGNFAKKALPVASGLLPFIPGVGGALSGVLGAAGRFLGGSSAPSGSPSSAQGWNSEIGLDGKSGDSASSMPSLPRWEVTAPGSSGGPASPWSSLVSAAAPAVGAIASGAASAYGQREANVANAEMAQKQMDFQERMSNTQWQRGTKDMQAAGLNPMLAYSQGGASSPSGASAVMSNELGTGVSSALQAAQGVQQIEAIRAGVDQTRELTRRTAAEIDQIHANTGYATAQEAEAWARIRDQYPAQRDLWGAQVRKYNQETQTEVHNTRRAGYSSQLEGLKVPGAENEAERQRKHADWFTSNMPGYITDAYTGAGVVERLGSTLSGFIPKKLFSTISKRVGG
jgi:hypothetical protein